MSAQDKIERILKQIHVLLANGEPVAAKEEKVIVDKKEVLSALEQLNLAIYEIMDQYEVTSQARELAHRRSEKKGEEMIERISAQAEDVYAASLIYTDDALSKLQNMMADAMESSQEIWRKFHLELEQERRRMKEDQLELRGQLQDFKDSNKYLVMIEDCNRERERQEKDTKTPEKRIQNEAKHYAMNAKPEIKVNPAYFERRGIEMPSDKPEPTLEPEKNFSAPEIKVDLDAEYFKWQAKEGKENENAAEKLESKGKMKFKVERKTRAGVADEGEEFIGEDIEDGNKATIRKEWKSLFGKK